MKNINHSFIAYFFYALGTIDYVSANFLNNDLTGIPYSPIIFGGIGSIFMFLHNSKIKESNNNVYEIFKLSLFAVLISDDIIDESELEYSSSILNTLENKALIKRKPRRTSVASKHQGSNSFDLSGLRAQLELYAKEVEAEEKRKAKLSQMEVTPEWVKGKLFSEGQSQKSQGSD